MKEVIVFVSLGVLLTALAPPAVSQNPPASPAPADTTRPAPCSTPEYRQLDFWVGEWDLAWGENGGGTNTITRTLDGCVIQEEFADLTPGGSGLRGTSVSTYDAAAGEWKQTWVDNTGSYLDFTGGMSGDTLILARTAISREGQPFQQRMWWGDLERDRLAWHWERSADNGKTWEPLWTIRYTRRQ